MKPRLSCARCCRMAGPASTRIRQTDKRQTNRQTDGGERHGLCSTVYLTAGVTLVCLSLHLMSCQGIPLSICHDRLFIACSPDARRAFCAILVGLAVWLPVSPSVCLSICHVVLFGRRACFLKAFLEYLSVCLSVCLYVCLS
jgi:hypothetical protein